jgi:diacylglycerol kinase family enzyme
MQTLVIFNPYSGRGNGLRAKDPLCAALKSAGIKFDMVETEHPDIRISSMHRTAPAAPRLSLVAAA